MKKEELMKLEGMTEELATKIAEQSAEELKGMIPKTRLDEVIAERDSAKKDHADVLKQLGALQKESGDDDGGNGVDTSKMTYSELAAYMAEHQEAQI